MAIILNEYRSLFIREPDKPDSRMYFDRKERVFTDGLDHDRTYLVPVPQVGKIDVCTEYLELKGISVSSRDAFGDEFSYMEHIWSITDNDEKLDEEMEQYVKDFVLSMMADWIKKNSLENMKISYQSFDNSILELNKIREGIYGMNNDQCRLREYFYSVQVEKEKLDEELYKLKTH